MYVKWKVILLIPLMQKTIMDRNAYIWSCLYLFHVLMSGLATSNQDVWSNRCQCATSIWCQFNIFCPLGEDRRSVMEYVNKALTNCSYPGWLVEKGVSPPKQISLKWGGQVTVPPYINSTGPSRLLWLAHISSPRRPSCSCYSIPQRKTRSAGWCIRLTVKDGRKEKCVTHLHWWNSKDT